MPLQQVRRTIGARHAWAAASVVGVASVWLAPSCTTDKTTVTSVRDSSRPAPGHWVYSADLRAIMGELDRKARTAWPQEMSGGDAASGGISNEERAKVLARMSPLATELSAAARRIPDAVSRAKITPADRNAIAALAVTLGEQADSLQARIRENNLDDARRVLYDINATCMSCHDRFRDLCGPMDDSRPRGT